MLATMPRIHVVTLFALLGCDQATPPLLPAEPVPIALVTGALRTVEGEPVARSRIVGRPFLMEAGGDQLGGCQGQVLGRTPFASDVVGRFSYLVQGPDTGDVCVVLEVQPPVGLGLDTTLVGGLVLPLRPSDGSGGPVDTVELVVTVLPLGGIEQ